MQNILTLFNLYLIIGAITTVRIIVNYKLALRLTKIFLKTIVSYSLLFHRKLEDIIDRIPEFEYNDSKKNSASLFFLKIKKYFKNKFVRSISLFLLVLLILYVLITTNTLIPIINFFITYKFYMNLLLIIGAFYLATYYLLSYYLLIKFSILYNKGVDISISPLLPDLTINYLEKLKLYSSEKEAVKIVTRMYLKCFILFTLLFIFVSILIFYP